MWNVYDCMNTVRLPDGFGEIPARAQGFRFRCRESYKTIGFIIGYMLIAIVNHPHRCIRLDLTAWFIFSFNSLRIPFK